MRTPVNFKQVVSIMKSLIYKVLLVAICLVVSTSAFAVPTVDGFLGTGFGGVNDTEYTNSFDAGWYNGHKPDSQFTQSSAGTGVQVTTVYWDSDGTDHYLYIEAPLVAKNMIWGTGFTPEEIAWYTKQWNHKHSGNVNTSFQTMTDSEKLVFGSGIEADLNGDVKDLLAGLSLLDSDYKDSVDYVLNTTIHNGDLYGRNEATTTDSNNPDIPMAFEFKFGGQSSVFSALLRDIKENGLAFHMSPERGADPDPVPEPATIALLGIGLVGLAGAEVRRRRKKKAVDNS